MRGIPHHLLDVADPKKQFSAAQYKTLATNSLRYIVTKSKLPIVVGGTGLYIDALAGTVSFPDVPPNPLLRKKLAEKSASELFKILKKKDPKRARTIDPYNKVRLIRALEIINTFGHVPMLTPSVNMGWKFVFIGLKPANLDKRIYKRLIKRLPDIIHEVRRLHKQGLSWKRMHELGLEYRYIGMYLQNKIPKQEIIEKLYAEIRHYAKRQMTWFKRNKKTRWFTLSAVEGFKPTEYKKIENYLVKTLGGE